MSEVAVAQYGAQPPDNSKSGTTVKTVSITGKISADGTTFVSDKDSKSWTISNPDAVKGHEGHHVTLQAQVDADKNEVHVVGAQDGEGYYAIVNHPSLSVSGPAIMLPLLICSTGF